MPGGPPQWTCGLEARGNFDCSPGTGKQGNGNGNRGTGNGQGNGNGEEPLLLLLVLVPASAPSRHCSLTESKFSADACC